MVGGIISGIAQMGIAAYGANQQQGKTDAALKEYYDNIQKGNTAQLQMFNQARQDYLPNQQAGLTGMGNILGADWTSRKVPANASGQFASGGAPSQQQTRAAMDAILPKLPEGYRYGTAADVENGKIYKINTTEKVPAQYQGRSNQEAWERAGSPMEKVEWSEPVNLGVLPPDIQSGIQNTLISPDWGTAKQGDPGFEKTEWGWTPREGGPTDYWATSKNALIDYGSLDTGGMPDINTGMPSDFNFDFKTKLDPDDPLYKFKLNQATNAANARLAKQGLLNSRHGVNVLSDTNMKVASDEVERQYGREKDRYGMAVDKYGFDYKKGSDIYGRGMDQNNALYDRNQSQKWNMLNAVNALSDRYYGRDLDLAKIGANAASSAGAAALTTGQGLANSYGGSANAAMIAGRDNANTSGMFWSGVGGLANNALSSYWNSQNQNKNYTTQPQNEPW